MIQIHLGLSLLAMKKLCENYDICVECPLQDFCYSNNYEDSPCFWSEKTFPDAVAIVDIKKEW